MSAPMKDPLKDPLKDRSFHHEPLLIFTDLAIVGAGLVAAAAVLHALAEPAEEVTFYLSCAFWMMLVGGVAASLHLGRKVRAPRAALGLKTSWLSRQVLLAGAFSGATLLSWVLLAAEMGGPLPTLFVFLAAVLALHLTTAIGLVYELRQQLAWAGWACAGAPLVSAFYLAACILVFEKPGFVLMAGFAGLWLGDFLLCVKRFMTFLRGDDFTQAVRFPTLRPFVRSGYLLRFLLTGAAMILALLGLAGWAVWLIAFVILLDRACHYGGETQATPRAVHSRIREERMRAAR